MKIESSDVNIESLFTSDFLKIPEFQRPYSWEDENLEDFWNDVVHNEGEDYFIGSMVLYKSGRQEFGVVDGQQRLTTVTILLCVLRNAFQSIGNNNLANGLHSLIERADRDSVTRYVVMTETSYPFFAEEIQKFDAKDFDTLPKVEEQRLQSSLEFFSKKINCLFESIDMDSTISLEDKLGEKENRLLELRDKILFLSLIRIELDNKDDAYLIFETLNTRGKDLELKDLLKNHFTKLIMRKSSVDFVALQWKELLSILNSSEVNLDPDTFITHSWSSRYEATTQQKAFKKLKLAINRKNAKVQLKDFVEDSKYYLSLFSPDVGWSKGQQDIVRSLNAMRIFRITQHTPGVLSLVRANKKKLISDKALKRALRAIEDFHFLFTAVTSSRSSGGISSMYSSFGRRLFEVDSSNAAGVVISDLIDKLNERKPSVSEFVAAFEQISYTNNNTKQSALVRYILQRLASHEKLAFSDDFSFLTIEHIYPQSKINSNWPSELVGSMGNLILLTSKDNVSIKDDGFDKKIVSLRKLTNSVPKDILDSDEWTPEQVQLRTAKLAEIAYNEIWKVKY